MCDYSLHTVASRDAKTEDVLVSCRFPGTETRGFCTKDDPLTAVCLRPGTELAFEGDVRIKGIFFRRKVGAHLARFRQVDTHKPTEHHDALEFSNGRVVKVTDLAAGQRARVLQMPADPASRRTATPVTIELRATPL
ncbi:hypothetical protein SSBR45G_50240 [Bradyrhizobium sp. SSBR45G]|uniref:hypothetical protein n=1 Tax=unclassified Bradyrhizobium TaxID=2631580 RepID=UPI002342A8FF|nr:MULTISPECIES: hypothetical protein [unclassified Bradyrhizobium]GLH80115.1 hypothetical protein SSBR45G_50240 [Bradyrhizobium sp. SSBR45G]GLH87576.1 hypothetical protein SSBR45R_50360 [Bradyrhizobium sp. SSBR45R]